MGNRTTFPLQILYTRHVIIVQCQYMQGFIHTGILSGGWWTKNYAHNKFRLSEVASEKVPV